MSLASSRRQLLQSMFGGLGLFGVAGLLSRETACAAGNAGHYAGPRIAPKAKHVINLFLSGGPSQVDLFDPKPALSKYHGKPAPSGNLRTIS